MGLDIYHYKVSPQDLSSTMILDEVDEEGKVDPLQKFAQFAVNQTNQYIDWKATFAKKGLDADHYDMFSYGSIETGNYYQFARLSNAPQDLPEQVEFFQDEPGEDSASASEETPDSAPASEEKPLRKDLVLLEKDDRVIPYQEAGYQRKSVIAGFYEEFPTGWEIITDKKRVERIYELTADHAQPSFKENFLDNWDDEKSFVIIWY